MTLVEKSNKKNISPKSAVVLPVNPRLAVFRFGPRRMVRHVATTSVAHFDTYKSVYLTATHTNNHSLSQYSSDIYTNIERNILKPQKKQHPRRHGSGDPKQVLARHKPKLFWLARVSRFFHCASFSRNTSQGSVH